MWLTVLKLIFILIPICEIAIIALAIMFPLAMIEYLVLKIIEVRRKK